MGRGGSVFVVFLVALLTVAAIAAQYVSIRATRAGTPPPAPLMARLGISITGLATLSVVFAVLALN